MNVQRTVAALVIGASTLAFTPAVFAQEDETDAEFLEEVVVTGIRSSLQAAVDLKRSDARIIDAVVAEDIGKLPDNNIAEALQRVTGVSIVRDFGVGDSVSIRGLSQNRVELNGRTTTGDDRDGISLQDFPSSFLSSVEVIKSPTADMIEGALGGTVNMTTVRPLDLRDRRLAGSIDYEYADKTEEWAPIFNVSAGDVWDLPGGGSFGVIGLFSYQDRTLRQDEFKNRTRLHEPDVALLNAVGLTSPHASGRFVIRDETTLEQYVEERERTAYNVSLQWAPASEAGSIYIDLGRAERSGLQNGNSTLQVGGQRVYSSSTTQDAGGQVNDYAIEGVFAIPKTWAEFRETESDTYALGFDWDLSDSVAISGEVSLATSESSEPDSEFNLRPINRTNWQAWAAQYTPGVSNFNSDRTAFGLRHTFDETYIQRGDSIPSVVNSDPQAYLNPENLALRRFVYEDVRTDNDEAAARFDVEFAEPFDTGWFTSLKTGVRFTKNDYSLIEREYLASNLYRNVFFDQGTANERPFAMWIDEFEALFPGSFVTVDHPNSFNQHGLSGQNDLLQYTILDPDLLNQPERVFDMLQQVLAGTNFERSGSFQDNLELQEGVFRDITEETAAFYVSADLDFERLRATVGARYVQTDVESTVFVDGSPVTGTHDYDDILPSLNVSYDLTEDTLIRFAAAKVMRRANYEDLSPAFEIGSSLDFGDQGSLELDPFRATQFDFSLEHYFGDGNLVSFAVFYKDVESFLKADTRCLADSATVTGQNVTQWDAICLLDSAGVTNPDLRFLDSGDFATDQEGFDAAASLRDQGLTGIIIDQDVNGEDGVVQGIELGYQQHFDFLPGFWSGFGVSANYTYADSEQPNGNPLLDIAEHTINTQVYWENETFQARLAYNYRDELLESEEENRIRTTGARALNDNTNDESSLLFDVTAGNNYRESRGQLDLSASWAVNDNITVVGNVVNLTEEPITFLTELGSPWYYIEADRRLSLGLRATFE